MTHNSQYQTTKKIKHQNKKKQENNKKITVMYNFLLLAVLTQHAFTAGQTVSANKSFRGLCRFSGQIHSSHPSSVKLSLSWV